MKPRLQAAYDAALAAGKYEGTYAATTLQEYWAEGVQSWFDTNITVPPGSPPDGIHNEIGTRDQLKTYDLRSRSSSPRSSAIGHGATPVRRSNLPGP